ncbi:SUMF1/EgtB/PvdO family nonheme iron enzyme [Candidatus Eisenbacteria bacterium]|uniref:SUMF1/EgtB/PvdO family nonheme iron enzyme n=1 Tax=Eiseniibacteriota bacterium TaxID=2212470 RepID=A0ABV6YK03_UNCEI
MRYLILASGLLVGLITAASSDPIPNEMVRVPSGVYVMGEVGATCGLDEHEVTLSEELDLGQHEVTNQEYLNALQWAYDQGYVTASAASVLDNLDGSTEVLLDLDHAGCEIQFDSTGTFYLRESPSVSAQIAYPEGYDPSDHPVKAVSWFGAVRYCDWLSLQAGLPRAYEHSGDWMCNTGDPYAAHGYRLPTDAEWEYAAQWDDERRYPWGNGSPDCSRANYRTFPNPCVGWTAPVGSYPFAPQALGLANMGGNLREWCDDWWVCDLGTESVTDPTSPADGTSRMLRGGNWDQGLGLRCATRLGVSPVAADGSVGFRVAKTAIAACCVGSVCVVATYSECDVFGGAWIDGSETCDPSPCVPVACCIDDVCQIQTPNDCLSLGGAWQYLVQSCDPNPCIEHACCIDTTCATLLLGDCLQDGGYWLEELSSCDPNPCPQLAGACCFPDGTCSMILQAGCDADPDGTWFGGTCDPNPCPQPEGACCFPDESCQILTEAACAGDWLGMDLVCDPNPCPIAACCIEDVCETLREYSCVLLGGEWQVEYASCTPDPCMPDLIILRPDGSGDFPTIQTAITASAAQDTIELEDGIYVGDGNRGVDFLGRAIVVRSQSGDPRSCVIDCEYVSRGFSFQNGESEESSLEGVTIRNGADESGAGIYFYGSSPRVSDCILDGNHATLAGGGMYSNFASPTVSGCTFSQNVAQLGGAMFLLDSPAGSLLGCTLAHNSAASGGGVFCNASAVWMEKCIVAFGTQGEATFSAVGGTVTLSCSDIYGNAGGDWVGGIADQLGLDDNFALDPCFCDPDSSDYYLCDSSPCLHLTCGQIGAWPQGCEELQDVEQDPAGPGIPANLVLLPNTPNPFGRLTHIAYGIPTSSIPMPVQLTIHDCGGRLVRYLSEVSREPGNHRIAWDGTGQSGESVPAGVYFYQLRWNGRSATRRMLVVR